ncbi:thymidylate kinase [Pelomyxa schiedti]|nr:thymidylate kinase [Pelomyxa schiedti]
MTAEMRHDGGGGCGGDAAEDRAPAAAPGVVEPSGRRKRGLFVVFEGLDRCGKTTQSAMLHEYLCARDGGGGGAVLVRYPNRTTSVGSLIDQFLKGTMDFNAQTIHLLYSANRWESTDTILNNLKNGITVISDRYAYSGTAYTGAKGLDVEWCKNPDRGLPRPDVVFYLKMPAEFATKRSAYGEERYDKEEFQSKVAAVFNALQEPYWCVIDATKSIQEIHEQIVSHTNALMSRCLVDLDLPPPLWS